MRTFALVLIPLPLALASGARAETYTVHPTPGTGDFLSPAEALASPLVVAGDRIEVLPGTYVGPFVVDKAVRLVARSGAAVTVLDGGGSGPVLEIRAGATVRGFTITGGGGSASVGGVWITSPTTVHLIENRVVENHPGGAVGVPVGGVGIASGASARLRDNEIRGNTSLSVGGLLAGGLSSVELFRDRIHGNGGSGTTTGGLLFGASGRLVNVQITGNHGSGVGGLYLAGGMGPPPSGASVLLSSCTIYGNFGASPIGSAGGVFLDDGGAVTIRNTLIHSNLGASGSDMLLSSDFASPPAAGFVDIDDSLVGTPAGGVIPGVHMLPPFLDPLLVAPVSASPFGPAPFGDFRPASLSPLLQAGLDSAFPTDLPPTDADRFPRISGPAIDIGAFEPSSGHLRRASTLSNP